MKKLLCIALLCIVSSWAQSCLVVSPSEPLTGYISTPYWYEGLVAGGDTWNTCEEGLTVSWEVSQNDDKTWHYLYTFTNGRGKDLKGDVSHFIISVSKNLTEKDIFHFSDDEKDHEIGTYQRSKSNPGFPSCYTLFGLKIDLQDGVNTVSFDSYRQPMWGDIYVKGGGNPKNYAYNLDFGTKVKNPNDYTGTPVDRCCNPLYKILVPDTIPEPATLAILSLGMLFMRKLRV